VNFSFFKIPNLAEWESRCFWCPQRHDDGYAFLLNQADEIVRYRVESEPGQISHQQYVIDDEVFKAFDIEPLSAANWVYLLDRIRSLGSESVAIAQPLSWPDADEISLRALEHQLSCFLRAAVAVEMGKFREAMPFPAYLEPVVIPFEGDMASLPEVNGVVTAPSVSGVSYGFHSVDLKTEGIPLLARWGERLLPSIELAYFMSQSEAPPAVKLGKHIVFPDLGPVIPIDEYGCYRSEASQEALVSSHELILSEKKLFGLTAMIEKEALPYRRNLSAHLSEMASRVPRDGIVYRKAREVIPLIVMFALLLLFRKTWLIVLFLVISPLLIMLLQKWLILSPFLAMLLVFMVFPKKKKLGKNRDKLRLHHRYH